MTVPRPLLIGERIRLTAFEPPDYPIIAAWSHDPEYMRNLRLGSAAPESSGRIGEWIEQDAADNTRFGFAIRPVDAPDIIGIAVLKDILWANRTGQMALAIGPANLRGQGLGAEAVGLLVDFAFDELSLHRLGLTVISYNRRAIETYLRHGFVQEGTIREAIERDGARHDLLLFGLLASERS